MRRLKKTKSPMATMKKLLLLSEKLNSSLVQNKGYYQKVQMFKECFVSFY